MLHSAYLATELGYKGTPPNIQYGFDQAKLRAHRANVPERDVNEEATRLVRELTKSEPVNGEDLIESEDLKRQFREAKERLASESAPPGSNQ